MRSKDQVKEHDQHLEKWHIEVLNLIKEEDQETLDSGEKIFNKHVNRVSDIIERLDKTRGPGSDYLVYDAFRIWNRP